MYSHEPLRCRMEDWNFYFVIREFSHVIRLKLSLLFRRRPKTEALPRVVRRDVGRHGRQVKKAASSGPVKTTGKEVLTRLLAPRRVALLRCLCRPETSPQSVRLRRARVSLQRGARPTHRRVHRPTAPVHGHRPLPACRSTAGGLTPSGAQLFTVYFVANSATRRCFWTSRHLVVPRVPFEGAFTSNKAARTLRTQSRVTTFTSRFYF